MSIASNLVIIEERIEKACAASGRKRDEITLMAVSKLQPPLAVEAAWQAGLRCFGESRVQEAAKKFEGFREAREGAQLHLIGSLQRNKARAASALFDCVQSVDRESLIVELAKCSSARETPLPVLLELHTGEDTKSGFASPDDLFRAVELILGCGCLRIRGLMTMAPDTRDEGLLRASFRQVIRAQKELERRFTLPEGGSFSCLSMGMSGDFEIAVQEGSTMLRIGSALFTE